MRSTWLNELRPSDDTTVVVHLGPVWPPQSGATIHNSPPIRLASLRRDSTIVFVTRDEPVEAEREFARSARCPILWIQAADVTLWGSSRTLAASALQRRPFHVTLMSNARRALPGQPRRFVLLNGAASGFVRRDELSRSILSLGDFDPEYAHNSFLAEASPVRRLVRWVEWRLTRRYYPDIYNRVTSVITVSEQDRELVQLAASSANVATIPVTVDLAIQSQRPQPITQLGFLGAGPRNMASVTWTVKHVIPGLRQRGIHLPFRVAGRLSRRDLTDLNTAIRAAGLPPEAVCVVQSPDNPGDVIGPGSVLLCPFPYGAGVKVKCLEAMLRGCLVATNAAGARGTPLVDGLTGIVAESGNIISAAVADLIEDGSRACSIAAAGQSQAIAIHGGGQQDNQWQRVWTS